MPFQKIRVGSPFGAVLRPFGYEAIVFGSEAAGLDPAMALRAVVTVMRIEGSGGIRFLLHGDAPTATVGVPLYALDIIEMGRLEGLGFLGILMADSTITGHVLYYDAIN